MKIWSLPFVLSGLFFAASCTPDASNSGPAKEEEKTEAEAGEPKDEDMIGLMIEAAEAMAKERGLKFRTVSVDGDSRPVTMDYLLDRVNFTVEAGKVVKVNRC